MSGKPVYERAPISQRQEAERISREGKQREYKKRLAGMQKENDALFAGTNPEAVRVYKSAQRWSPKK